MKFSGIGRSRLYELIDDGKIRSVCLRERQKVRGIRLVNVKSLHDYIASFERNGKGQAYETAGKRKGRAATRAQRY
jgi:hypothetical protein